MTVLPDETSDLTRQDQPALDQSPLRWRPLETGDLPVLSELARRCVAVDGGQPFAADPGFLARCYLSAGQSLGAFDGQVLACASSLRPAAAGAPPGPPAGALAVPGAQDVVVTTGMVDPRWRRLGVGGQALDWALTIAGGAQVIAETEALSTGAHALYVARGLSQVLAEDVLRLGALAPVPAVVPPAGLTLTPWPQASPARFFAIYEAAFRDRPGFPGQSQAQWVTWISDDDDFRPEWTLLACLNGADVGFVAGEATGWITQVGVVPQARGQAIGAYLVVEAVRRMRAGGETAVTLNVSIDNPRAADVYNRLGFRRVGGRARYRRDSVTGAGNPGSAGR